MLSFCFLFRPRLVFCALERLENKKNEIFLRVIILSVDCPMPWAMATFSFSSNNTHTHKQRISQKDRISPSVYPYIQRRWRRVRTACQTKHRSHCTSIESRRVFHAYLIECHRSVRIGKDKIIHSSETDEPRLPSLPTGRRENTHIEIIRL